MTLGFAWCAFMHSDKLNLTAPVSNFYGIPPHRVARNALKKGIFVGFGLSHQIRVNHFLPKFSKQQIDPRRNPTVSIFIKTDEWRFQSSLIAAYQFSQEAKWCVQAYSTLLVCVCVFIMREEPNLERNQLQRRNKIVATIISVNAR